MFTTSWRWSLWMAPMLLAGCVDFDGQNCSFRYDAEKDELHVFQVYERIHAAGSDGRLSEKERTQIDSVIDGGRTFFFNNWLLEYARKNVEKRIAELAEEIERGESDDLELRKAEHAFCTLAVDSVKVTNGEFFLNKKGELCGYQTLTVVKVSQLIDLANQGINVGMLANEHGKWTEQIHKFAKAGGKWVELDGNELTIRYYTDDVAETKGELAELMADGKPAFENVATFDEPFIILTFGTKDAPTTGFQVDNLAGGKYNTLVLDYVRKKHEVAGMLNVERVREKFLAGE